jgi:hypothetical protein
MLLIPARSGATKRSIANHVRAPENVAALASKDLVLLAAIIVVF